MSGEELPTGTVIQHADVLRALLAGVSALEQTVARAQRRALLPGNVGRSWTVDEEGSLIEAFKAGEPLPEIAIKHGRTLRAIEARLEKLGVLALSERSTSNSFIKPGTRGATKAERSSDKESAESPAGDGESASTQGDADAEGASDAQPP